ncbi:hypothetical protein BTZ20_5218 [Rhodococcus sp. MTM3W5.2]|nr:hypothetical protein BTZ20_5218 [Rhodococcus sp. MTM3W5.2]
MISLDQFWYACCASSMPSGKLGGAGSVGPPSEPEPPAEPDEPSGMA